MGNQDVIGFYFAYDWLRERGASFLDQSQSEVKENQLTELKNQLQSRITFGTQLKTALEQQYSQ